MPSPTDWIAIDVPELDALPMAVTPRSQNLAARQRFPLHAHRWHQFVYATAGTLVVTVAGAWYVITPEQAIWVPAGVPHTTGTLQGAEFRNLYVADMPGVTMPSRCTVFAVTALLRALIVELEAVSHREEDSRYIDQLNALALAQLARLPAQDFYLPWPHSARLTTICLALYADPADARGLALWGRELGASGRTLARHFEKEVGLSFRAWRYRLRLFLAIEWLCAGRSITDIALSLGYASTAAFTYMFRQEMGAAPTVWRERKAGGLPSSPVLG
ncbi:MAG: helix-turn-helix transcriptional regulator [Paludibacterium sp.]|uniref:AraC family transcriptional regulator n=1 Tax=Paludibacterium sp. TaxID=1917523 RepID=UPI0025DBB510|nr:helix-turn-helix transcriptional regulator [Paludibacterium sp.]MBV8048484.1 helix-turn-helix transcriptional regulator [Paludibacterium sp.]